ncbi:beta-glucuronidase-like isoform X2 [Daktulosphaira vitifoliae]|uniref:beta-glucuronidase-like isoform X2 n=1 Tax=Daktulosphaira vitifoliae TaxID=58002 RepID=UPI0021AA021C|nr:beta-glucuronidase-like isoform X2 [Daktulosphaira vitifoliae]
MSVYKIKNIILIIAIYLFSMSLALLFPTESESREIRTLHGFWNFKISPLDDQLKGFTELWYTKRFDELGDYFKIPVPSSYNDVTTNMTIRDYVGWYWYQREFFVPKRWTTDQQNVFIRFGSVNFKSIVWLNGYKCVEHVGGHLPFICDATSLLKYGEMNLIVVAADNTLRADTIPQGYVIYPNDTYKYPNGYRKYSHDFEYFDYSGINQAVYLYTTPKVYVCDITVNTSSNKNGSGIVIFKVDICGGNNEKCEITLLDSNRTAVASMHTCIGQFSVPNAILWWPFMSGKDQIAYMYTFQVKIVNEKYDVYRLPIGIRTLQWTSKKLLLNGESIYLRGFGKHEDSILRGRGYDDVLSVRDFNLIKWLGANSFRTSHYPYAEETLQQADFEGIMVILESAACAIKKFDSALLESHKVSMTEIIQRDKNHPSIIMWSLANEPENNINASISYFQELYNHVRKLDSSRPITFVNSQQIKNSKALEYMDILTVNRYDSWYSDSGHLELIQYQVYKEVEAWNKKFEKPVLITEYGAGSLPGLHSLPETMWSEDYHVTLLNENFKAFDSLITDGIPLLGEMIWNFADFKTPQSYLRPGLCMKGLFTRERQPKMVAYTTRNRYHKFTNSSACFSDETFTSYVLTENNVYG